MLRVISGKFKGKKLLLPSSTITRPMRDLVKESLFSMLQFDIENKIILDAFAGSGSLGIEAISRGAMKVIALESNKVTFKILKQNIDNLQIHNLEAILTDVLSYLKRAIGLNFNLIFLDPPFKEYDLTNQVLMEIFKQKILNPYGFVVLHTDKIDNIVIPNGALIQKHKRYGINHLLIISNNL